MTLATNDLSQRVARVTSLRFTKSLRLLNSSDFQVVFDDAPFRASHKHFLILARPNGSDSPRLGLIIAKKNIRLAVQRNRMKRIIRETFRQLQIDLKGVDAVVLARRGMDQLDSEELARQLNQQWHRVKKKAQKHFAKLEKEAPDNSSSSNNGEHSPCAG